MGATNSFILLIFFHTYINARRAITYKLNGGRLGDTIMNCAKCKFYSYIYNIPFFYRHFKYADQLQLSIFENKLPTTKYKKRVHVSSSKDITLHKKEPDILFESHYYSKTENLYDFCRSHTSFKATLKKMFSPKNPQEKKLDRNYITVALHIRKGGGFDLPLYSTQSYNLPKRKKYADRVWPDKFPPEQYFINLLILLSYLTDNQPIYAYLFTDDPNPSRLLEHFNKVIPPNLNIIIDCRRNHNNFNTNVVEDLYYMSLFDVLIRSESNFAKSAQLIGEHKVVFRPAHFYWQGNALVIDKVQLLVPINKRIQRLTFSYYEEENNFCLIKKLVKEALDIPEEDQSTSVIDVPNSALI